jgi:hypothetical protein
VHERERDRRGDAVPAGGHHQVKRNVAERVEIALRARGVKILRDPPGNQLER